MKKSHIIWGAVILYLMIMVMGGTAYYVYSLKHEEKAARIEQQEQAEIAARRQAREEAAAKEAPAAEKKKTDEKLDDLQGSMKMTTIQGVTYYKHRWPSKPETGVYLRPFVAERGDVCVLKNDIYYFYSITDEAQTAWIFGDRLSIYAGGQETIKILDPSEMRKRMASDASWLAENYVMNADEETIAAFRRIAASGSGYMVYYKEGGKSRRHDFTAEDVERIREMLELYDTLRGKGDAAAEYGQQTY